MCVCVSVRFRYVWVFLCALFLCGCVYMSRRFYFLFLLVCGVTGLTFVVYLNDEVEGG